MNKIRTILFAVLLASFSLLFASMEYGWGLIDEGLMWTVFFLEGSVIWSLALLISVTFFSLDKNGQIAKNTLAWEYFAKFYTIQEKNDAGETVSRVQMPEHLKICPMLWMIVLGVFCVSMLTLVVACGIFAIGLILYIFITQGIKIPSNLTWVVFFTVLLNALTFFVILFGILISLARLCIRLTEDKKWKTLAFVEMMIVLAGLYAMSSMGPPIQWQSLNYLDLLYKSALSGFVLSAAVVVAVSAISLMLLGCSLMKNTLPGRLILSLYQNLCPVIPIETEKTVT